MILIVAFVIFFHMFLIWCWYYFTKNPSVVDVGWASGLTLSGLIYLLAQPITFKIIFLSLILLIWGLRLGLYLWLTRVRKGQKDRRYLTLSDSWKISKSLGFFLNFQLQGILILVVSLPWFFSSKTSNLQPYIFDYIVWIFAFLAIVGETLADYQLQHFKKTHPGKVCNQGLWRLSRHPNYFFEWLTWCMFALFALPANSGWLAFISPLALYIIMSRITGPMTEASSLKSRGRDYVDYQAVTPFFFPNLGKLKNRL